MGSKIEHPAEGRIEAAFSGACPTSPDWTIDSAGFCTGYGWDCADYRLESSGGTLAVSSPAPGRGAVTVEIGGRRCTLPPDGRARLAGMLALAHGPETAGVLNLDAVEQVYLHVAFGGGRAVLTVYEDAAVAGARVTILGEACGRVCDALTGAEAGR
ncbi:hypothetical protein [Planomonospora sp. ID82291]|uniref:hypothetical protein n=1 Tax=Planomonospora sp. ID82291 TaxID=2738136 RepID=UPI0018C3C296|nr:hypothetical protein [Planomonospora sp. ID82291]MBG0818295.1 hypothetical protein [Planomonospora sp. ID82291]